MGILVKVSRGPARVAAQSSLLVPRRWPRAPSWHLYSRARAPGIGYRIRHGLSLPPPRPLPGESCPRSKPPPPPPGEEGGSAVPAEADGGRRFPRLRPRQAQQRCATGRRAGRAPGSTATPARPATAIVLPVATDRLCQPDSWAGWSGRQSQAQVTLSYRAGRARPNTRRCRPNFGLTSDSDSFAPRLRFERAVYIQRGPLRQVGPGWPGPTVATRGRAAAGGRVWSRPTGEAV